MDRIPARRDTPVMPCGPKADITSPPPTSRECSDTFRVRRHSGVILSLDADAGFKRALLCACTHRLSVNLRAYLFRRVDLQPQHSADE